MPMPIRPADSGFSSYFPINMELFQNDFFTNASLKKTALANDKDADVLFYIWKNSCVINKENEIEKKIYRIKENVNKEDLLKLKASGLIVGDDKEIRFTNKAASIIKTMVLGEQNSFGKQSIKKPYSIILAEEKRPKRKSALALASETTDLQNNDLLKIAQLNQNSYFEDKEYYYNGRVVSQGVTSPTSNKEYNVRVYKNDEGKYEVWVFWGRTNGTLHSKKESTYSNVENARYEAIDIINNKKHGNSYYQPAQDCKLPPINSSIPGVSATNKTGTITKLTTPKTDSLNKNKKKTPEPLKPLPKPIVEKPVELNEEEKEQQRLKSLDQITDAPVDRGRLEELRKTLLGIDEDETTQAANEFNLKKYNAKKKPFDKTDKEQVDVPKKDLKNNPIEPFNKVTKAIIDDTPVEDVIKAIVDGKLKLSDIKDPSPELADRLIKDRKTAAGISDRFIRTILNYPNASPETLEILSNLRKDLETEYGSDILSNNNVQNVLKEIESKLLERATGEEPWALKIQIQNPPEDLNEIKSQILRKKYFYYLSQIRNQQVSTVEKSIGEGKESQWLEEKVKLRNKLIEENDGGEELSPVPSIKFQPGVEKGGLGILEQKQQLRKNLLNEE